MRLRSDILKKALKIVFACIGFAVISVVFFGLKAEAAEYRFNMSYIFFSDASDYTAMVDSAQNSLNEVSPNYFGLNNDGSLALTASVSADFVSDMHSRGIAVVPFLSNDWSRSVGKAALNNREQLSQGIAEAIALYDLDGVNIDIENVTSEEREAYVDFVRLLRALLPEGKTVVVSVAANPWGWTTGWQGSYDYAGLSEYCDYLMVMAYDEHYYGGPAGPVSSLSYVENALKYAVSLVPKDKIVLGLPFYGRIWSNAGGFRTGMA
jgi:spore germination protein YaaH